MKIRIDYKDGSHFESSLLSVEDVLRLQALGHEVIVLPDDPEPVAAETPETAPVETKDGE